MNKHFQAVQNPISDPENGSSSHRTHARCFEVLGLVCAELAVPARALFHNSRCEAKIANCRQLAMYLMNVVAKVNFTEVGEFMGRDRTTVSHACKCIEDERDDESFNTFVLKLEKKLDTMLPTAVGNAADEVGQ